jgi:hypothetical protein
MIQEVTMQKMYLAWVLVLIRHEREPKPPTIILNLIREQALYNSVIKFKVNMVGICSDVIVIITANDLILLTGLKSLIAKEVSPFKGVNDITTYIRGEHL